MRTLPLGLLGSAALTTQFAIDTIAEASTLALEIDRRGSLWRDTKDDGSPVTEADYSVQAYVGRQLESTYPRDVLVAEEDGVAVRHQLKLAERLTTNLLPYAPDSDPARVATWVERGEGVPGDRYWVLDPIDSTKGLLAGGLYCLNLALINQGQVEIAVIGQPRPFLPSFSQVLPLSGYLFVAVQGKGAWWTTLNGSLPYKRLNVSSQDRVCEARRVRSLRRTYPDQSSHDRHRRERVSRAFGDTLPHIRCAAPMRYPLLAAGQADLYVHLDLSARSEIKAWDHAAGSLLVEEAGGRVTDLEGRALDFGSGRVLSRNRGLVASNGLVHQEALDILKKVGEGPRTGP